MPRRKWDTRTKALIVLQGLKGTPVSQLCTEHQISQAQYYDWRGTGGQVTVTLGTPILR